MTRAALGAEHAVRYALPMIWVCPLCKQRYEVRPKHCPCVPYVDDHLGVPQTEYYLWSSTASSIPLDEPTYTACVRLLVERGVVNAQGKRCDGFADDAHRLCKQVSEWYVESASVDHHEIPLTAEEFRELAARADRP